MVSRIQSCHQYQRYTKLDLESIMEKSPYSGMIFGKQDQSEPPILKPEIPPVDHITSCILPSPVEQKLPIQGNFKPYVSNPKYLTKNSSTDVKDNSVNCVVD